MMERKRREIEQQRIAKKLHIEETKLKVYQEEEMEEDLRQGIRGSGRNSCAQVAKSEGSEHIGNMPKFFEKKENLDLKDESPLLYYREPEISIPAPQKDLTAIAEALAASVSESPTSP